MGSGSTSSRWKPDHWSRLTPPARWVLESAQAECWRFNQPIVESPHVLVALLKLADRTITARLRDVGIKDMVAARESLGGLIAADNALECTRRDISDSLRETLLDTVSSSEGPITPVVLLEGILRRNDSLVAEFLSFCQQRQRQRLR